MDERYAITYQPPEAMTKHADCHDRCQLAEHKGYPACEGECFYSPSATTKQRAFQGELARVRAAEQMAHDANEIAVESYWQGVRHGMETAAEIFGLTTPTRRPTGR